MARLTIEAVNERLENGGDNTDFRSVKTLFFKGDRDGGHIRFLAKTPQDLWFYRVHQVSLNSASGKKYLVDVDCIGENCPMCAEALAQAQQYPPDISKARDRMYIPVKVYDKKVDNKVEAVNELQFFVRPAKWYKQELLSYFTRNGNDISAQVTEIERVGEKGSQDTSYRLYPASMDYAGNPYPNLKPLEEDIKELEFDETLIYGAPDSLVRTWTPEQMQEAIRTHSYPKGNNTPTEATANEEEVPQPRTRTSNYGF